MHTIHHPLSRALTFGWWALLAVLASSHTASGQITQRAAIDPVPARVAWRSAPVIDGTVVIPLVPTIGATDPLLASGVSWAPLSPGPARLDDDRRVPTRLRRLAAAGVQTTTTGQGASWFPPAVRWVEDDGSIEATRASVWFVEVRVPAGATWCEIGGRRVTLFEQPPSHRARTSATFSPLLQRTLSPLQADPTQRWRCAWLGVSEDGAIDDPLAARWALGVRARWDEAARRLGEGDPPVLRRVEQRLVAIGAPFGEPLPLWIASRDDAYTLLRELLDDASTPAERVEAARSWLDRTPGVVAWVVDDRPLMDEGRLASCEIGLLVLDASPTTVEVTALRGPARLTPDVPAGDEPEIVRLPIDVEAPSDVAIVRHAGREVRLGVIGAPLTAQPPALLTGDFYSDHTRATFGSDAAPPVTTADRTRASLLRLEPGRWRVTVECQGDEPRGAVELWTGDRRAGRAPLRLTPDATGNGNGWVFAEPGRWIASFDLTLADHVDTDGLLRLAIVRTGGAGGRQAWPRPMTPGQVVPGRLAIDPSSWASPVE
ncbi:MAG: hypothetical protein Tsb0013_16250 [Phycisphaerales bacterium]